MDRVFFRMCMHTPIQDAKAIILRDEVVIYDSKFIKHAHFNLMHNSVLARMSVLCVIQNVAY